LNARRRGERGQVAIYAVLLFPVLMLVLALVLAVGALEGLRTRIGAQVDMAAITATQGLDVSALSRGEEPRLIEPQAEALAREYLARNLAATSDLLAATPADIASGAEVVVTNEPGTDPLTGTPVDAPTVSIRVAVPARIPLLGLAGLTPTVTLTITGSAAART
jgi:Flp pilus assembly protein TadG